MAAFTDGFPYVDGSYLVDQTGWGYFGASLPEALRHAVAGITGGQAVIGWGANTPCSVLHNTASPEHYVEADFVHPASGVRSALVARAADGNNWVGLETFGDYLRLIACVNGVVSVIHGGAAGTYIPGSRYRLTAAGTSYTVSRNAVVIGEFAAISFSDPAIDGNSRIGFEAVTGNATGIYDNLAADITAVGAIALNSEPLANRVYQEDKTGAQRTFNFSGIYAGDVTAIEFRLEGFVSGVALAGFDWQDLPAGSTFSGGNWTLQVVVPSGPWVRLRWRAKNHPTTVTGSTQNRWGVGILVALDGQSNIQHWADTGYSTADELVAKYDPTSGDWIKNAIGTAENIFCARIAAQRGCVVGYCNVAVGSTDIQPHVIAGYWTTLIATIDAMGGDISLYVWKQGESDTGGSGVAGNVAAYVGYFTTLATNLRSHCSRSPAQLPIIVCPIGRNMGVTANDQDWTNIREAHYRVANVYPGVTGVSSCFIGGDAICLPHSAGNGLHEDLSGNSESAARAAQSYLKAVGLVANDGQGPIPLTAVIFGLFIWVSFNLNGASALAQTAAGNLVGWVVRDSTGTVLAGTTTTLVGNQVRIALPGSPPAGPYTVAYLEGEDPLGGAVDATTVPLVRGNVQLRSGGLYTEAVATRKRLAVSTGVVLSAIDVASMTSVDAEAIVPLVRLSIPNVAGDITVDGKAIVPIAYLQTASVAAVSAVDAQAVVPVMPLSLVDVASSISVDASAIKVGNYAYTPGNQRRVLVAPDSSPYMGEQLAPPLPTFFKDPASTLDFSFDWATLGWLTEGERIVAVDWDMPSALHSVFTSGEDGLCANWFAGGVVGETYTVQLTVRTNIGRIDNRAMLIEVVDR